METRPKEDLGLPQQQDGFLHHRPEVKPMGRAHHHDELEFNLVTEGTAAYLLGERRYDLHQHTLAWFFPEQDHLLLDQSRNCRMWLGVFKPELLRRVCTTPATQALLHADPPGHFSRQLTEGQAEGLTQLFSEVAGATDSATFNAGLGYALLAAWEAFGRADEVPTGTDVHPAIERAARLIRDEIEPLSLEGMAARVGLSASYLSTLFRQQTGMDLAEFRNKQRLQRFLRLYGQGRRLSMLEAALEAGFGSYPQFYRVFIRQMGCSPQDYRNRVGKGIPTTGGEQSGTNI